MHPRWKRRILIVALAWLVLTALGTWATTRAWTDHQDGPIRIASNIAWVTALPGWVGAVVLNEPGVRQSPFWIAFANGSSWAGWGVLVLGGMWLRDRIAGTVGTRKTNQQPSPTDPSRRAFLTNSAAGACAVCALTAPGYATLIEPWSLRVRRYSIPIDDLPASLDGLRLVQISDTHLGPKIPESFVEQVISRAIGLEPDLFILTGDYISYGDAEVDHAAELLAPLPDAAPLGALGVLGNHDWWGDGPGVSRALTRVGVTMIDNDRVWLDAASRRIVRAQPTGPSLAIPGLGDLREDKTDIARAFAGIDPAAPRLLITHEPDTAELRRMTRPGAPRVDLMLCGHTHGGQVRLPLLGAPIIPSRYGQKYAGGFVRGPAFPVIVSRGVGMSGIPVRIGVPPEIGLITLTRV